MSAPSSARQPASSRNWGYSRGWRLFSVIILRALLRLLMSHEWQGKENFPGTGGVILAPNHLSYADWPTIALFSDAYGHRYPVFMIKSAVFEVTVLGPLLRKLGQLPVYRGRSDAGLVLRQAKQALRGGACVIVYPEGTATRDPDLWPMAGRTGAARLALTTGAPVIPIAHWGAQDILPYGSKRPRLFPRRTVRMAAGPPVDLSRYAGQRLDASTLRAATADIMADITALLAGLRQQTPPAVPYDPAAASEIPPAPTSSGTQATSDARAQAEAELGKRRRPWHPPARHEGGDAQIQTRHCLRAQEHEGRPFGQELCKPGPGGQLQRKIVRPSRMMRAPLRRAGGAGRGGRMRRTRTPHRRQSR